jgi:hypothetical protein
MSMGHDIRPVRFVTTAEADAGIAEVVGGRRRGVLGKILGWWTRRPGPATRRGAYLSASYARRQEVQEVAAELRRRGVLVTSTWHEGPGGDDDVHAANAGDLAVGDLREIKGSAVLVAFTESHHTRAGHHAELGAAAVLGHRLVVVGPVSHHFHRLPWVEHVADSAELCDLLGGGR